jgi:hypothetical protein
MSSQWDAANPTAANGVTDKMIADYEARARTAKARPLTVADVEASMRLGIASPKTYALYSAATADQLRNYLEKLNDGRKKDPKRFGITAEAGGLAALTQSISPAVPNFTGPILNAFKAYYLVALQKRVCQR